MTPANRMQNTSTAALSAPASGLDRDRLRAVLGRFATGITILAAGRTVPSGMTANAFTSVSLDPPLVLICVRQEAAVHQAVLDGGSFAVSVLAANQEPVARFFANHARPRGTREFESVSWTPGPRTGLPVLADSLAWLECGLLAAYGGGDHSIFMGRVLDMGFGPGRHALLFFGGAYHCLKPAIGNSRDAQKQELASHDENGGGTA